MTDRRTVDTINDDQLSQLYDDLERARQELADHAEAESADAAAGSYAGRAERVEAQLTRVTGLYEQWVKAGPPPLGTSMARWWDRRLVELREAIHEGSEQPARTTANNPAATEATDTGNKPDTPAWTPPPPGSTAEQLPETLLALIRHRLPDYTSTACQTADTLAYAACYPGSGVPRPQYDEIREHAERLHERCRTNQKFTGQLCACGCHPEEQQ